MGDHATPPSRVEIPYGSLLCCVALNADGQTTEPTAMSGLDGCTDPVRIASHYREGGAEWMFVDVSDSWDGAGKIQGAVRGLASTGLSLVVSVDNGRIRSVDEVRGILGAGASAVTVNTTAVDEPALVTEATSVLGGARIIGVVNVTTTAGGTWDVRVDGGERSTGLEPIAWSARLAGLGVGSIVINDMDRERAGGGFNLRLLQAVTQAVSIPIICGGGSRQPADLSPAFTNGAHAVLVLTMLHDGTYTIGDLLTVLREAVSRGHHD